MKNIFKPNSRFSILTEELSNVETKNNTNKMNTKDKLPIISKNNLFKNDKNNEIKNDKKKNTEFNLFSEENFPTLGGSVTNNTKNNDIKNSYSDMLKKKQDIKKKENKDENTIKPGTVKFKFNRETRQIEHSVYIDVHQLSDYEQLQEEGYNVLDALVRLHERRTNEYINNWGYDEWEKLFRFPNHDYYYFDRLDELYEEELEKELEKEEELNKLDDELYEYEEYIYNYE